MRQNARPQFVLFLTSLCLSLVSNLFAVDAETPSKSQSSATTADESTSDLDEILTQWEVQSANVKSLHGYVWRNDFNLISNVEKVSSGPFYIDTIGTGRIDFLPAKIKNRSTSRVLNTQGKPFSLEAGQSKRWIFVGNVVLDVNDMENTYRREVIPEGRLFEDFVPLFVKFLLGMKKEDARQRFDLSVQNRSKDRVIILERPRNERDSQDFEIARILLNTNTYLVEQIWISNRDQTETIYKFDSIHVNAPDAQSSLRAHFKSRGDVFSPNLAGYQQLR